MSCVNIVFHFLYLARLFFWLCVGNPILFWSLFRVLPLILIHCESPYLILINGKTGVVACLLNMLTNSCIIFLYIKVSFLIILISAFPLIFLSIILSIYHVFFFFKSCFKISYLYNILCLRAVFSTGNRKR